MAIAIFVRSALFLFMKQILSTYKILPVLIATLLFATIDPIWGNYDTKITLHNRDKITIDIATPFPPKK
jgi:hypothetical protein